MAERSTDIGSAGRWFSTTRVLLQILLIIAGVEVVVMSSVEWLVPGHDDMLHIVLDAAMLTAAAGGLILVLVIRPLIRQLSVHRQYQRALRNMLQTALEPAPLDQGLDTILDQLIALPALSVEKKGGIFLCDPEDGALHLVAQRNLPEGVQHMCGRVIKPGECLCGHVAETQQIHFSANIDDPLHTIKTADMEPHGHYVAPLVSRGGTVGVLNLYLRPGHVSVAAEVAFLHSVADTLAGIIAADRIRERAEYSQTLQAIMDHAPFGIWLADTDGKTRFTNRTLNQALGVEDERLLAADNLGAVFGDEAVAEFSGNTLYGDGPHSFHARPHIPGRGTREFKLTRVDLTGTGGVRHGVVGIAEDLTETHQLKRTVTFQATHDRLTGVLNRNAFQERLAAACADVDPESSPHTLCVIDLNQFKLINDTAGYAGGDEVLRQLTRRIKGGLRKTEAVSPGGGDESMEPALARIGGDEFALLLYHCSGADAMGVAQRLVSLTDDFRCLYKSRTLRLSCSIGLAEIGIDNHGPQDVLQQAEDACGLAKQLPGRIRLASRTDEAMLHARGTANWAPRIIEGIEHDRFALYQQRIVPLDGNENGDHFEVLLRFIGKDGVVHGPGEFMESAERYTLMPKLDRWVIDNTFKVLDERYNNGNGLNLARATINLSGQTLGQPWLERHIISHFNNGPIRPAQVCFEITETAAVANLDEAVAIMSRLREFGCRVALDDFGSGMSSFNYLDRFPLDTLKIDGALVRTITNNPAKREMVAAINRVGHFMGLTTVAEWVEDGSMLDTLSDMGVDYAQGHAVGVPLPLDNPLTTEPSAVHAA